MSFEYIDFETIKVSEEEISSLELSDVSGLITKGSYLDAAILSRGYIAQGYLDIRLLGYYLFGALQENISGAAGEVFQQFYQTLQNCYSIITPAKQKEKHVKRVPNWFFDHVIEFLNCGDHHESSYSPMDFPR